MSDTAWQVVEDVRPIMVYTNYDSNDFNDQLNAPLLNKAATEDGIYRIIMMIIIIIIIIIGVIIIITVIIIIVNIVGVVVVIIIIPAKLVRYPTDY